MKLSEAIREGAKLRPQAFGAYRSRTEDGQITTCALGAAYEAASGRLPGVHGVIAGLEKTVGSIPYDLHCKIMDWNDDDHFTREQIADLVEAEGL